MLHSDHEWKPEPLVALQFSAITIISAIGRAVRDRLPEGKMTWKRIIRPACEKFTPENIAYCESYINFMSTVDPFRVKFFDEAGF